MLAKDRYNEETGEYINTCNYCGSIFYTDLGYQYGYCNYKDCQKIAKRKRLDNLAKQKRIESRLIASANAEQEFLAFLDGSTFIRHFKCVSEFTYDVFYKNVKFEAVWQLMRCGLYDYHLRNSWRVPCKAYLKKNHPEICELIKDI